MAEPDMVEIPEGPFLRGSPDDVGLSDEHPQRTLFLPAFAIDRLPVTFGQFSEFIQAGGYDTPSLWTSEGWAFCQAEKLSRPRFFGEAEWAHVTSAQQPACGVSFWEAQAYAHFVNKRLPTEAEWEKAARGEDGRMYPWGDDWDASRCSCRGGPTRAAPAVGGFPQGQSPYGVWDMSGGVWEWCSDWYQPDYYREAPERSPQGPLQGRLKVARGGAWNAMPLQNRTANRNAYRPVARFSNVGFRCARSLT